MQKPSLKAQTFDFYSLRLDFSASGPFIFPTLLSANIFRGAFGLALRRVSPTVYEEIFAPAASLPGPSGLLNPPRPFVFRTRHLDAAVISPGERFHIGLNVFIPDELHMAALLPTFSHVFEQMALTGFGPQRSRARLQPSSPSAGLFSLPILSEQTATRIRVDFLTPTELKSEDHIGDTPQFAALLRRARDRISTLRALYGPGPLKIDFAALNARAAEVQLAASEIEHAQASRRSSRTGERHPLGGFVGFAEYAGNLSEFLPYLHIAAYTGIGRQSVWGKGEITTRVLA